MKISDMLKPKTGHIIRRTSAKGYYIKWHDGELSFVSKKESLERLSDGSKRYRFIKDE